MLSLLLIIGCHFAVSEYRPVALLQESDDKFTYLEASIRGSDLDLRPIWKIDVRELKPHYLSAGRDLVAILFSDAKGLSHLEIRRKNTRADLVAVLKSRTGFTFEWISPTHLRVAGEKQGMRIEDAGSVVEVVPEFENANRESLFSESRKGLSQVYETVVAMGLRDKVVARSLFDGNDLLPLRSSSSGAYDLDADRFVLTLIEYDDRYSVRLFEASSRKEIRVLQYARPRRLCASGGLVAVLDGDALTTGDCQFFNAADGKSLRSIRAICIG